MAENEVEEVQGSDLPEPMREALREARSQHGDVFVLNDPKSDITVICRRPDRDQYLKFREAQESGPAKASRRFEELFVRSLAHPTPKVFEPMLDRHLGIGRSFGMALWNRVLGFELVEEVAEADIPDSARPVYQKAVSEYGEAHVFFGPETKTTAVFRRPVRAHHSRFMEEAESGPTKASGRFERLCLGCVVAPSPEDFKATLARLPALADSFGLGLHTKFFRSDLASVKKA